MSQVRQIHRVEPPTLQDPKAMRPGELPSQWAKRIVKMAKAEAKR
jgi:hypothetical protein